MGKSMARYYFDFHDGQRLMRDTEGSELNGQSAIEFEAVHALPMIMRDGILKDDNHATLTMLVRNTDNTTVYTAMMTFTGQWLGEEKPPTADDLDQVGHPPLTKNDTH